MAGVAMPKMDTTVVDLICLYLYRISLQDKSDFVVLEPEEGLDPGSY